MELMDETLNLDSIQKISRLLIQPVKNLMLRIHVKLVHEKDGRKENFHNIFTIDENSFLKLDVQSFLTLELKDGEWAKDKSIIIDQKNIYQVVKGFERCLEAIYHGGVFAITKDGKTVIYQDMVEKHTQRIYNLGGNQRIVLKPAIIYDETEVSYEGVILYINKTDNFVEFPIDAFEALYYTLKNVNLFVYSQLLINYFVSALKEEKVELRQVTMERPKKKYGSVFDMAPKETVQSKIVKEQSDEDFFNMKKE